MKHFQGKFGKDFNNFFFKEEIEQDSTFLLKENLLLKPAD